MILSRPAERRFFAVWFVWALFVSTVVGLNSINVATVSALDPSEETAECFNHSGVRNDRACIMVNCEWDNVARNWPDDIGYHIDCPNMLIKIKGYSHPEPDAVQCAALMPGCGYCPGTGNGSGCYLTEAEFIEYSKDFSGLESEKLVRYASNNPVANIVNSEGGGLTDRGFTYLRILAVVAIVVLIAGAWALHQRSSRRKRSN